MTESCYDSVARTLQLQQPDAVISVSLSSLCSGNGCRELYWLSPAGIWHPQRPPPPFPSVASPRRIPTIGGHYRNQATNRDREKPNLCPPCRMGTLPSRLKLRGSVVRTKTGVSFPVARLVGNDGFFHKLELPRREKLALGPLRAAAV